MSALNRLHGHNSVNQFPVCSGVEEEDTEGQAIEKKAESGPIAGLGLDLLSLGKNPVYILTVLGSTLYVGNSSASLMLLSQAIQIIVMRQNMRTRP